MAPINYFGKQMLSFSGEFNHAYSITYEKKPKMLKRLATINLVFLFFQWNTENVAIAVLFNIFIYFVSGLEVVKETMHVISTQSHYSREHWHPNREAAKEWLAQQAIFKLKHYPRHHNPGGADHVQHPDLPGHHLPRPQVDDPALPGTAPRRNHEGLLSRPLHDKITMKLFIYLPIISLCAYIFALNMLFYSR